MISKHSGVVGSINCWWWRNVCCYHMLYIMDLLAFFYHSLSYAVQLFASKEVLLLASISLFVKISLNGEITSTTLSAWLITLF